MTTGIIHSLEPIRSAGAYGYAVFGRRNVRVEADGKKLYFWTKDNIDDVIASYNVELVDR